MMHHGWAMSSWGSAASVFYLGQECINKSSLWMLVSCMAAQQGLLEVKQQFIDWCRLEGGERLHLPWPNDEPPASPQKKRQIICRHWFKVREEVKHYGASIYMPSQDSLESA